MGWSSASSIMDAVIDAVLKEVPDQEARERIYRPLYSQLVAGDWDTEGECVGKDPAYDKIYKEDMDERWGPGWDEE